MARSYLVTGSGSGIGEATAELLRHAGHDVIGCDLANADVEADLATPEGRAELRAAAERIGRIDGAVAVAGVGAEQPATVSLNYFGTLATLDALRPSLLQSDAPRAVVVSSLASILPIDEPLVAACLSGDETRSCDAAEAAIEAGSGKLIYGSTKAALNRWVRRAAPGPDWGGAGIPLNAVAPGVVDTPGARNAVLDDHARRAAMAVAMPQVLGFPGPVEAIASLLAWCVSADNSFLTGQILFADGGAEATLRADTVAPAVQYSAKDRVRILARYAGARVRGGRTG